MSALDRQEGGDHYKHYKIQPMVFFILNRIPHSEACVMKYALRHREKGGKQDLLKAIHILETIIELEYPEDGNSPI